MELVWATIAGVAGEAVVVAILWRLLGQSRAAAVLLWLGAVAGTLLFMALPLSQDASRVARIAGASCVMLVAVVAAVVKAWTVGKANRPTAP